MKESLLAEPAKLVRLKVAEAAAPVVDAVTWKDPACPFAVIAGEVAMPSASVITVAELPKLTLAPPEEGAAKVTEAPGIGFWKLSCTSAFSGEV